MKGFLLGIGGIVVGSLMVIYTDWIIRNFGRNRWAEQHLSTSGGSRLFYNLIGIAIIFISLLGMTGLLGDIILGIFGGLFGGLK
ncbi:MAG: hypothetical protein ABEJ24_03485 [Candidatus Magasanikbacteria bacterium]